MKLYFLTITTLCIISSSIVTLPNCNYSIIRAVCVCAHARVYHSAVCFRLLDILNHLGAWPSFIFSLVITFVISLIITKYIVLCSSPHALAQQLYLCHILNKTSKCSQKINRSANLRPKVTHDILHDVASKRVVAPDHRNQQAKTKNRTHPQ